MSFTILRILHEVPFLHICFKCAFPSVDSALHLVGSIAINSSYLGRRIGDLIGGLKKLYHSEREREALYFPTQSYQPKRIRQGGVSAALRQPCLNSFLVYLCCLWCHMLSTIQEYQYHHPMGPFLLVLIKNGISIVCLI